MGPGTLPTFPRGLSDGCAAFGAHLAFLPTGLLLRVPAVPFLSAQRCRWAAAMRRRTSALIARLGFPVTGGGRTPGSTPEFAADLCNSLPDNRVLVLVADQGRTQQFYVRAFCICHRIDYTVFEIPILQSLPDRNGGRQSSQSDPTSEAGFSQNGRKRIEPISGGHLAATRKEKKPRSRPYYYRQHFIWVLSI
jgi:hypothetical protein